MTAKTPTGEGAEGRIRALVREGIGRLRTLDPRLWLPSGLRAEASSAEDWDEFYAADEDPYGYRAEGAEIGRYAERLAALGGRSYGRALEIACSIGVFTEMLAPRCERLLAVDVSSIAVERARGRLANHGWVTVERCELPDEMPEGPFDLIVCADVLYYWPREQAVAAVRKLEQALAPGGSLLAVHWRPNTPTHTMSGDQAQRLLARHTMLRRAYRRTDWTYRIERFDRV